MEVCVAFIVYKSSVSQSGIPAYLPTFGSHCQLFIGNSTPGARERNNSLASEDLIVRRAGLGYFINSCVGRMSCSAAAPGQSR